MRNEDGVYLIRIHNFDKEVSKFNFNNDQFPVLRGIENDLTPLLIDFDCREYVQSNPIR
jgi:hypothetical protein